MSIDPLTAHDLLIKIMEGKHPMGLQDQRNFLSDTILNPVWMDGGNVFWDASKRSYLRADTRAMAQEAMARAFNQPNGILALAPQPPPSKSTATASLLQILSSNTNGTDANERAWAEWDMTPASSTPTHSESHLSSSAESFRFTTYTASNMSQTSYASDADELIGTTQRERNFERQSLPNLVGKGEGQRSGPSGGEPACSPIRAPRPRRLFTIPFLHQSFASAPAMSTRQKYDHLRSRVTSPPTLDMSLVHACATQERLYGQRYEIVVEDAHVPLQSNRDDGGFDADDELEYDESELDLDLDDVSFEDVELTPKEGFGEFVELVDLCRAMKMPATPALQAIPLPPVSPVSGYAIDSWGDESSQASSDAGSAVTTLEYPDEEYWEPTELMEMLSPLDHLMCWDAEEASAGGISW